MFRVVGPSPRDQLIVPGRRHALSARGRRILPPQLFALNEVVETLGTRHGPSRETKVPPSWKTINAIGVCPEYWAGIAPRFFALNDENAPTKGRKAVAGHRGRARRSMPPAASRRPGQSRNGLHLFYCSNPQFRSKLTTWSQGPMEGGYLSSGQGTAERDDSCRNTARRRNCS